MYATNAVRDQHKEPRNMPRLVAWSLAAHLLILLVSFLFPSTEEEEIPRIRTVKLVLRKRVVSKKIVPDEIKESAPGQDRTKSQQLIDDQFMRDARKLLTARSRPSDSGPPDRNSRESGKDPRYDDLLKAPATDKGRLNRNPSSDPNDFPGRKDLNKDTSSRSGDHYSIGRDALSRHRDNRDPSNLNGSRRSNQGNKGSGVTGSVNVRGRKVTYRPYMSLPPKYSRQGLSHSVRVAVTVSPEGIITAASLVGTTGDAELDRILAQYARRFRLEAISSGGDQTGTIAFYIKPQ